VILQKLKGNHDNLTRVSCAFLLLVFLTWGCSFEIRMNHNRINNLENVFSLNPVLFCQDIHFSQSELDLELISMYYGLKRFIVIS
jgi:hypothetical protein